MAQSEPAEKYYSTCIVLCGKVNKEYKVQFEAPLGVSYSRVTLLCPRSLRTSCLCRIDFPQQARHDTHVYKGKACLLNYSNPPPPHLLKKYYNKERNMTHCVFFPPYKRAGLSHKELGSSRSFPMMTWPSFSMAELEDPSSCALLVVNVGSPFAWFRSFSLLSICTSSFRKRR